MRVLLVENDDTDVRRFVQNLETLHLDFCVAGDVEEASAYLEGPISFAILDMQVPGPVLELAQQILKTTGLILVGDDSSSTPTPLMDPGNANPFCLLPKSSSDERFRKWMRILAYSALLDEKSPPEELRSSRTVSPGLQAETSHLVDDLWFSIFKRIKKID